MRALSHRDPTPPSAARTVPRSIENDISDGDLVRRARGGDRWAAEALFRRHVVHATRLATRLLQRRSDADDATQEAFAEALGSLVKLRDPDAFRPWLSRIVVSRCRKMLRRRRMASLVGLDTHVDDSTLEQLACNAASAETLSDLRAVDGVLRTLATDLRVAWVLRYVQRESVEDIAELTGCSLATAKRRIGAANTLILARLERGGR